MIKWDQNVKHCRILCIVICSSSICRLH